MKELASKPVLTQSEILAMIKEYIFDVKGVNVNPEINTSGFRIRSEISLMLEMLPYCIAHFKNK
tara:strand:+ start:1689 stop:1880 length:192 start_codon:yes stop_codon:yes gene_type:complete